MSTCQPPVVVLIFGANCVGKSTVGKALAGCFDKGAFIEVDALRYLVVGGLVAYSAGTWPDKDPLEYERQCWLGTENGVRLAKGFAESGFSSVMEGLEDGCRPDTDWAEEAFGSLRTVSVCLDCENDVLLGRWQVRDDGGPSLPGAWIDYLEWHRENRDLFDVWVDTSRTPVDEVAGNIHEFCTT